MYCGTVEMLTAVLIYSHVYSNGLNGNIGNEFIKYMKYGIIVPYVCMCMTLYTRSNSASSGRYNSVVEWLTMK